MPPKKTQSPCRALGLLTKFIFCLSLFACLQSDVTAGESHYSVRTWQTDDGLPRNTISAIAQTPDGYLWLGTPFGVIRFDGSTFTRMEGDYHPVFTRARTRVLHTDSKGRLWIGTGTIGVIRHDGNTFTHIDNRRGLTHPTVNSICEDRQGNVWIGGQDGSLCRIDAKDEVHAVITTRSERGNEPIKLIRDFEGDVWLLNRNSFGRLNDGRMTNMVSITNPAALLSPSFSDGAWLINADTLELVAFNGKRQAGQSVRSPIRANQVTFLFEDSRGNLWLGSQRDGAYRYSNGEFVREFSTTHRILCIFEDSEANIWIGTEGGGLTRLLPNSFEKIGRRDGAANALVRSVCEDENGDIWMAGQGTTIERWDATTGVTTITSLTNIGVTSIFPKENGGIWIGTVGRGLLASEADRFKVVAEGEGFRSRQIRAIHQDSQGRLWLGCLPDGVFMIANGKITPPQFFFDAGLTHDAIWAITHDKQGNVWFGTITGELLKYADGHFSIYGQSEGLPGASIGTLAIASNGDLLIGTLGGGFGIMKNERFRFARVGHGLSDDVISSVIEDTSGNFWFSSDRGIFRVRTKEMSDFADGRTDLFTSISYGIDDGLGNTECIAGYQPASWKTRSGEICFATSKGAVRVYPQAIPTNTPPPKLVLESITLGGEILTNRFDFVLPHDHKELRFHFSAPSFSHPEHVTFRHQLIGLETDWTLDGNGRIASYPRLPPGRYEFRFTASKRDGDWNKNHLSFPFEVTPAYWQTAWFRVLGLIFFGVLIGSLVRYRYVRKMRQKLAVVQRARAVEQERMRIARDIHDDLGARLTQIALLSEMVAVEVGEKGKAGERLGKLSNSSREAVRSLDEIVWAINPQRDSLPEFVDYLSHFANELFTASHIRCRQDMALAVPQMRLSTEIRHHLFMACKEALNNALKHSNGTELWLTLAIQNGEIVILIRDNGTGFDHNDRPEGGNGLANMRERLLAAGGTCAVDSIPGQGTTVTLRVALPQSRDTTKANGSQNKL